MPEPRVEADSVSRTLALVGDRWTLLILREAFFGVRRFGRLRRNLGIAPNVLSSRLTQLVDTGLLSRVQYRSEPDFYEYRLTEAGRELFPIIVTLMCWGDRHMAGPGGPPLVLRHNDCGRPADAQLTCGHCGGVLTARNVTPEPSPANRERQVER